MAADFLRLMPRYVAGAGLAAGAAVAAGRYFQIEVSWQVIAIAASGMAISGAAVHAAAKRWTLRRAAERADTTLGLHDQIGNAIELASRGASGFGELAIASGEKVAGAVDVSRTVNLRWWSKWWIGSIAAASLAVAAWFYSPMPAAPPVVTAQDAKKALEDARKVAEAQPQTPDQPIESPKPELQELAQIEKELAQGAVSPTDAASRAANVLERVADERAKSAEAGKTQSDNTRESLAQAAKPATDKSPADSSALRKALQAGDLDAAAAEAQKLAENAESLTPDERSLLESDLRDLAQALDQQARESAAEADKLQQEAREARENSGEQAKPDAASEDNAAQKESNAAENPPQQDPKKAISDAARQAAEELKKSQPESGPKEKAPADSNQDKRDPKSQPPKSGEQKDESKSSEESPKDSGKSGEPKQDDSAKGETKPDDKPDGQSGEKPEDKAGEKPSDAAGDKQGSKPGEKPGEKAGEKTGQKPDQSGNPPPDAESKPGENKAPDQTDKPGEKTAPNQKDQSGKPTSDQNNPGQQPQGQSPQGQQSDPKNGEQKSTSEKADQGNSGKQTASEKPGENGKPQSGREQSTPTPGGTQPQGGTPDARQQGKKPGEKDGGGTGLQKLADQLKDLQKKSKDAASNEKASKEMREQARKILENMDPAQRKELQKQLAGAGKGEGEGNGPGDQSPMPKDGTSPPPEWSGASKIVDFRTKPGNAAEPGKERVISDWQKDMPDGQRDASAAGSAMEEDIRQAKESAERAIEQQSVPAQHRDLVRRVFEKFNQRVDKAKKSAPSATPAPDAKPAGGGGR